jgi:hypothetical protein
MSGMLSEGVLTTSHYSHDMFASLPVSPRAQIVRVPFARSRFRMAVPALAAAVCSTILAVTGLYSQPPPGRLIQEIQLEVPDSVALTAVDQVAQGPRDELYVCGRQNGRLLVFDAHGRLLRTIGRPGVGPGEFRFLGRFGWVKDSLWVSDPANRRISFFSADGQFRRSVPFPIFPLRRPSMQLWPEAVLAEGSLLIRELWTIPGESLASATGLLLLRSSVDGRTLDTLRWLRSSRMVMVVRLPSGGIMQRTQPWSDSDLFTLDPAGTEIIVIDRQIIQSPAGAHFRILFFGANGQQTMERRVSYEPIVLTAKRFDQELETLVNPVLNRFRSAREAREATALQLFRPHFLPPVRDVLVGRDHSIWLNVQHADDDRTWLVFDRAGVRIATVTAPLSVKLLAVSTIGAWGVVLDRDDVAVLVRYRIAK